MSKVNYTGGQVLTDATPGMKKKHFALPTMVFFIYCACAGGAFGIESMISSSGPGLTLLLLVLIPILWAMPIGLYCSELSNLVPVDAGPYVWSKMAFGEFWGFSMGFWMALANYLTGPAYVVLAVDYIGMYVPLTPVTAFLCKAVFILIFMIINLRGLEEVSIASTIFCIIILLAFTAVTVVGLANWTNDPFEPFMVEGDNAFSSWGTGLAIGVWMYCGYVAISFLGGEVENPQIIPKGMKIAIVIITLSYLLPTLAGIVSTGPWSEWGISLDYSSVLSEHVGTWAGAAFMIAAVIAQCSIFNTYIASGSRGFFSLADDYLAPPVLVKCDKKHGVPYIAVLTVAISTMILCMLPFGFVIILDVHMLIASYVLVYISAIVLRKKIPEEEYKFKIPGGFGFLVVLCIVPICVVLFAIFINGSDYYLGGMTAMASGPVLYFIWKRMYGGLAKKDPVAFPVNEKTGMAKGDTKRIALLFFIMTVMNVIMLLFTPWYEGWGTADSWESGDYFDGIIENVNVDSIVSFIGTYMDIFTVACALICVVMFIISKKVEKSK